MKTLLKLSAVPFLTGLFFFSAAGAQERKAAEPKPVPMVAPAMKTATQENPQKKKENPRKKQEEPKIAVSDPGVPNERPSSGKKTAAPKPAPALAPAKKEKTETNPQ